MPERVDFGVTRDGRAVHRHRLDNGRLALEFLDYGGVVTAIEAPDRDGRTANVVVALPNLAAYEALNRSYFLGAIVGRYAGRIADARFAIEGREYRLEPNDGPNALHGGGRGGFDTQIWTVESLGNAAAVLRLSSPDGAGGFPGRLDVAVTYRLEGAALHIAYEARADAPTVLNLTNHSYFNLAGGGSVLGHHLEIAARRFAEVDAEGIPTGRFPSVAGTRYDFRAARSIGEGYDNSWLLDGARCAGCLSDPNSGRTVAVETTEPTLHIYTADHFGQIGVALETQHLPDSPNRPDFPTTELRPGGTFRSTTTFRFGIDA